MISNPATFFISGSDKISFIYNPGKHLYHFSPNDNNLNKHMGFNIVFFADNEAHGLSILKKLFNFIIRAKAKYLHDQSGKEAHYMEFKSKAENVQSEINEYLKALNKGKIKLTKAPMNQVFKVGWACNDTL